MGRVDRQLTGEPGVNTYEVHLDFDSFVSIFLRIMQNKDKAERTRLMKEVLIVLRFLLVPTTCYHTFIENSFERAPSQSKSNCETCCFLCRGEIAKLTGRIQKKNLILYLTKLFATGKPLPSPKDFLKSLKGQK